MASKQPTLTLCMIVKNESANLPRCLRSAHAYVDEIVVVDTGSEDDTVAIAREFGAILGTFVWCNDFAAARNASLSLATSEWILVLDADEELIVHSPQFRQELEANPQMLIYNLKRTDVEVAGEQRIPTSPLYPSRLFRNLPDLKYRFRAHEQLSYREAEPTGQQVGYFPALELRHYGYTDALLRDKHVNRLIPLLEDIRQKEGLSLLQLATLANTYLKTDQPEQAQGCFAEAYDRLLPHFLEGTPPASLQFVPYLLQSLAGKALEQEDYETLRVICQRGLEWFENFPPLNYLTANLMSVLGFPRGAIAYLDYCLQLGREGTYYKGEPFDFNFATTYAAHTLGCTYLELRQWHQAKDAFELALSFNPDFIEAQTALDHVKQVLGK